MKKGIIKRLIWNPTLGLMEISDLIGEKQVQEM